VFVGLVPRAGRGTLCAGSDVSGLAFGPADKRSPQHLMRLTILTSVLFAAALGDAPLLHTQPVQGPHDTAVAGQLDARDRVTPSGTFVDDHSVSLRAGELLVVSMGPADFIGRVRAVAPDGMAYEATGAGAGATVRLELWAADSGSWTIEATSAARGVVGAYDLAVAVSGEPVSAETWPTSFVETGWLGEPEDDALESGEFIDVFVLRGHAGDWVELDVRAEFGPYLALISPSGEVIRGYEPTEDGLQSRIRAELPEVGQYTIGVTSDAPEATGAYTLKIQVFRPSAERGERLRATE